MKDYLAAGESPADARAPLEERGQRCIGGFEGIVQAFSPPEQRAKNHAATLANARLLAELGGTNLVFGVDGPTTPEQSGDPLGMLAAAMAQVGGQLAPLE